MVDPRIALIGLVVGVLVGISGVGSSSLVTPLMILVMGIQPLFAIGTNLVYSVPTKLVGALVHRQQGTIDRRVVAYLCAGGLPGAGMGVLILWILQARLPLVWLNAVLPRAVAVLLVLVAALMVAWPLLTGRLRRTATGDIGAKTEAETGTEAVLSGDRGSRGRIVALGAVVGWCVSLTSIGSGVITLPMLYLLLPGQSVRRLIGAEVAFAACLVPVAALGYVQMGSVDWGLAANLLLGSVPGVIVGEPVLPLSARSLVASGHRGRAAVRGRAADLAGNCGRSMTRTSISQLMARARRWGGVNDEMSEGKEG